MKRGLAWAIGMGLSCTALAQSTTGSIFGQVPAGEGDSILIKSSTGVTRETTPDARGRYAVGQLPVGTYSVVLQRGGQAVETRDNIAIRVGTGTEVSFLAAATAARTLGGVSVSANQLPSIDVTSVDSRTVITADQLAKLPMARSAEAIAQLAPGVVNNSGGYRSATGQSLVSFGGSSASENAYYINGFNTTDPLKGFGGITLPYGSIDQEEVYTGGYSAQYGRSDGGVINMVGKRGTNEWHFGGQLLWQPAFARANEGNVYLNDGSGVYDPNRANHSWVTIYDAYVGGPLIKDKLFFFASAEAQRQQGANANASDASTSPPSYPYYTKYKYTMPKWYGKLDWNITDSNILEVTGASNKYQTSGTLYNYDYDALKRGSFRGYADDTKAGGDLYTAKFTSYITDNLTLTALYGKMKTVNYDQPANYDSSLTYVSNLQYQNPALTGGQQIGNGQTVATIYNPNRSNKTSNLRLDLTWQVGNHTLSAGIDNQNAQAIDQGSATSGPGYRWIYGHLDDPTTPISDGLGVGAPADYPNGAAGYYVDRYTLSSVASVRSKQRSQYVEDKWQVSDRLLLSLGLRNDQYTDYNAAGQAYIKQTSPQWAPRLGFSWDVNGDSSFKVYGNAGRYYLGLPLQPSLDAAGGNVRTDQYFTYGGINADGTPSGLTAISGPVSANNNFGVLPDPKTVTAKGIKAENQDEFILGFTKTAGPSWVYGAKLSRRVLRNAVDDYCDVDKINQEASALGYNVDATNSCYLFNPGRANTFVVIDAAGNYQYVPVSNAQLGLPRLKRQYYGLETFLEHPFDGTWYGKLTYVFSRSYGNTEGQLRSDLQQTASSESEDWDNAYIMENTNGPQSNDHTHQIKFFGYYQITPEWLVSTTIQLTSGSPKSCLGYYGPDGLGDPAGYENSYHWCNGKPSPLGSTGRYPWMKQVDVGASYRPAFAGQKLAFSLNLYNVFNKQAILNAYPYSQSAPGTADPKFGTAQVRQLPRYVQLGVTYDY